MEKIDVKLFRDQISTAFNAYDFKKKGYLTLKELRSFVDHIRGSIGLLKADDQIFDTIHNIIDDDHSGTIELDELFQNMKKIMPVISQCGEEMQKTIRKAFGDFDINSSGFLEKPELKLLFNLTADKLNVERPTNWQIDYIISLIDEDSNCKVDLEEMTTSYRLVTQELIKNKKLKRKSKTGDFFKEVANPD
jgi:Ca2+-binding EF-hand superfamily protein